MDDITEIKEHIIIINDELGETVKAVANIEGQLVWITRLLALLLGASIVEYFI